MTTPDQPSFHLASDEGEAFHRQLCEYAGIVLIGVDCALKIRTWNRSAASLFGASAEGIVGTDVLTIWPVEQRAQVEQLLNAAIDGPDVGHLDLAMRDQHGELRELVCTFAPVLDEEANCLGASIGIRDITSRVATMDRRHQSTKMMALADLAGKISHHFNNVLGGAITSLDFAASTGDAVTLRRVAKQVSGALFRASSLVSGLKTFAEGATQEGVRVELASVIHGLEVAFHSRAEASGVRIHVTLDLPCHPSVPRDVFTTMLQNIMQNAMEAMPTGGELRIQVSAAEGEVTIALSDTGPGLDEETASRVFEPFWGTKNKATGSRTEATGLGLAVVHGLATMIGARVDVESVRGEGSRFLITFPLPKM